MKHAVRNGTLIPEEEAVLPVTRREVFFNFSVYESLKVLRGAALFVEDHLERLFESARILELAHSFDAAEVVESIDKLAEADSLEEATIKLLLVGGDEPLYIVYSSPLPTYPDEYYKKGISVITCPGERILPRAKSNCLLLNYLAGRAASRAGAMEALLVDRNGMATEGTRSNLFAVCGGAVVTAEEDVLYGVTRKHVLEISKREGMDLCFEKLPLQALTDGTCSELFISSTSMGAMPISLVDGERVDGKRADGERVGRDESNGAFPVAGLLNEALAEAEEREIDRR